MGIMYVPAGATGCFQVNDTHRHKYVGAHAHTQTRSHTDGSNVGGGGGADGAEGQEERDVEEEEEEEEELEKQIDRVGVREGEGERKGEGEREGEGVGYVGEEAGDEDVDLLTTMREEEASISSRISLVSEIPLNTLPRTLRRFLKCSRFRHLSAQNRS